MSAALPFIGTVPAGLADVPLTAAEHFKLALFGVIATVIESCADSDMDSAIETHPFLSEYADEMIARTGMGRSLAIAWQRALAEWEREAIDAGVRLPLLLLQHAGIRTLETDLLLAAGLVEEDPRFADVFERAQRGVRRPTIGLLTAWWQTDSDGDDRSDDVRRSLQTLRVHGLLQMTNTDAPRSELTPTVPMPVWDALRGEPPAVQGMTHVGHDALPSLGDYVAPASLRALCDALPRTLLHDSTQLLIVRGPAHNGRMTLVGGLARAMGKSMLVADDGVMSDEQRWRLFGAVAAMADALPVVALELAPGESRTIPALPLSSAPLVIITGRHGAWTAQSARPILTIELPIPLTEQRLVHWRASLPTQPDASLADFAAHARLTSGSIRRAATAAASIARLDGRDVITNDDVRQASRTLQASRLEMLATRIPAHGSLRDLAVDDATREELEMLIARCRFREQLSSASAMVAPGSIGVRALLAGPSGTGKTLAARLLASSLGKDLFRVDLSATVNKYLGETEKNLHQAFAAAEELDVVLLLDEGDALMSNRTDVGSSNDRYANLETNFLLQRIETYDGVLVVTSNAPERIDRAFARRMDVVVNFRPPDEWRRYEILKLHLASEDLDEQYIQEIACRCALTGGQLRNVASDARLLALQENAGVRAEHLYAALTREYRKRGASCPLRPLNAAR